MEIRFTEDTIPYVSTQSFHNDRERAPHLEQHEHRGRLLKAAEYANELYPFDEVMKTIVDLGCGDGGLLSQLDHELYYSIWGYDFQPANIESDRGVDIRFLDVINEFEKVEWADVAVMTETLEHLADPHAFLRRVYNETAVQYFIASSPNGEDWSCHDSLHVWGWDFEGYKALFEQAGWTVVQQEPIDRFQILLAER